MVVAEADCIVVSFAESDVDEWNEYVKRVEE